MNPTSTCNRATPHQRGFSMIEVLVTLLIISLALLGTAGLQAYSMRLNQAGQFRSQAVFLVADLAERIEANKPAAVAANYVKGLSSTPGTLITTCSVGLCDAAGLAAYDLSQWESTVATVLPQSSWEVVQTVAGNPSTYTIRVSWVDRQADTTNAASDASSNVGANADGTGERFFYTATRTVFDPLAP